MPTCYLELGEIFDISESVPSYVWEETHDICSLDMVHLQNS